MIDKVLEWCWIGVCLVVTVYCLFAGLRVLNITWDVTKHSVFKTLDTLIDLYLPVMFPFWLILLLEALFKVLEK